jgi:hypothetical protein
MLKWKSRIQGNAAQAREAARKIVRGGPERLDELVQQLIDREVLTAVTSTKRNPPIPDLFGKQQD